MEELSTLSLKYNFENRYSFWKWWVERHDGMIMSSPVYTRENRELNSSHLQRYPFLSQMLLYEFCYYNHRIDSIDRWCTFALLSRKLWGRWRRINRLFIGIIEWWYVISRPTVVHIKSSKPLLVWFCISCGLVTIEWSRDHSKLQNQSLFLNLFRWKSSTFYPTFSTRSMNSMEYVYRNIPFNGIGNHSQRPIGDQWSLYRLCARGRWSRLDVLWWFHRSICEFAGSVDHRTIHALLSCYWVWCLFVSILFVTSNTNLTAFKQHDNSFYNRVLNKGTMNQDQASHASWSQQNAYVRIHLFSHS